MTAIANYKAVTIAQITATAYQPTQIVAGANAQHRHNLLQRLRGCKYSQFSGLRFPVFAAWFMRWYWMREDARAQAQARAQSPQGIAERNGLTPIAHSEPEPEFIMPTPPKPRHIDRPMTADLIKYTIPCAQEPFDIFAENLSPVKWHWYQQVGNQRTCIRCKCRQCSSVDQNMRAWMHINGFGVFNDNDEMTLVQAGQGGLKSILKKDITY